MKSYLALCTCLLFFAVNVSAQPLNSIPTTPDVTGSWDTRFSPPRISIYVIQADYWKGQWYVLGDFTPLSDKFMTWNEKSQTFQTVGGIDGNGIKRFIIADEGIYAVGSFQNLAGIAEADYIALWDGQKWSAVVPNLQLSSYPLPSATNLPYINTMYKDGQKWYIGGCFTDANSNVLADYAFTWDGQNLKSWDKNTSLNGCVSQISSYHTQIIATGAFTDFVNPENDFMMRLEQDEWKDMGKQGLWVFTPTKMIVFEDNLYALGSFQVDTWSPVYHIMRWDGKTWSNIEPHQLQGGYDLQVFKDKLYVFGVFVETSLQQGVPTVGHWDGAKWISLAKNPSCYQKMVSSQTQLVTTGCFEDSNGYTQGNDYATWNNGAEKLPFKDTLDGLGLYDVTDRSSGQFPLEVTRMVSQDNSVVIAGNFKQAGQLKNLWEMAKWNGTNWESVTNPQVNGQALNHLFTFKNKLYTQWSYSPDNLKTLYNFGFWDNGSWNWQNYTMPPGLNIIDTKDNFLLTIQGQIPYCHKYGCVPCKNTITTWNGSTSNILLDKQEPYCANYSAAAADDNNNIYLLATLSEPFAQAIGATYKSDELTLIKWDGQNYKPIAPMPSGCLNINECSFKMVINKGELYLFGQFKLNGTSTAQNIARWDGTRWNSMGNGLAGKVNMLLFHDTGIYAGGAFKTTLDDNVVVNGLARFDGTSWRPVGNGTNGVVNALASIGNQIFVGGNFTKTNDVSAIGFNIYHIESESGTEDVPKTHLLISTFPNPFQTETNLRIESAVTQKIDVVLYDILGRKRQQVFEGVLAAGQVQSFNITGSNLEAGIYLCKITGDSFAITRKIVFIK